jgi:hypothetical protein
MLFGQAENLTHAKYLPSLKLSVVDHTNLQKGLCPVATIATVPQIAQHLWAEPVEQSAPSRHAVKHCQKSQCPAQQGPHCCSSGTSNGVWQQRLDWREVPRAF